MIFRSRSFSTILRSRRAAYLGEACDAAYGLLALLCRAAQEQVGDAFLADDVRHVVPVDHDGRQIELELLGELEAIELLDKDRHHLLAEGLDELDDQFAAARQLRMAITASRPALSHGSLGWRRPCASEPMLGAPPKPAMRSAVTVELLPLRSICSVDPMNRSVA